MAKIATFYDHIKDISRQEGISVLEAIQEAGRVGVEALEISQNNILGREDELGHELSYTGMGISSIPAYFNFGRDLDVDRQSDPTLEAARFLGAKKILVIPGFFEPQDSPEERARQTENMAECINRLADKAAAFGLTLTMEDYDGELAPFSTAAGVRYFLDRCPGLSSCFDTGNFRFMAEDEVADYELLKDRVDHVHLKDRAYTQSNGEEPIIAVDHQPLYPCPVGGGDLKIAEIVSRLKQDGYDGIYTVEHYGSKKMLEYLRRSVEWVKAHV